MNLNESSDPPSLNKSSSQNASTKILRSKRSSKTFSKIFPVPSQDSESEFHKSTSRIVRKPQKSKTRNEREARLSAEQSADKRFSETKKRYWNNFEAFEKTFNPSKLLNKKETLFSSPRSPPREEGNSARTNDSDRSTRRLISKKMTPLTGFGVSSIGKMEESLESIPSPEAAMIKGLQDMEYNLTPITNRTRKRVFHYGSNRDGFSGIGNNELPPISPPGNQFSFKVIHPKRVEQENIEEEPEQKNDENDQKEPEALDKDDAEVQAISASSSEGSEEGEEDEESDESFVDSLVEDNPYEDGTFELKKSLTLRTLHSHIRESHKYAGIRFVLFPDDGLKQAWDIVILVALLYTALIMPVRLAFIDNPIGWVIVDWLIDGIFMVDICMNFCTAYFDSEDSLVTSKKKIFRNYVLGWFIIDFICVFPFQTIFDDENIKYNSMFKLARLPRLYRLLKIIKLVRMVKVIKDEKQFQSYMKDTVKLGPAYERLLLSVTGMIIFCHVLGCVWFILISLIDSNDSWVKIYNLDDLTGFDQYIACQYYVIQTVVTVGYGDMTPLVYEERLIACFFMVIGVLFYSVFIGFLSSLVSDIEVLSQKYSHKLFVLNKIKHEYGLSISFTKQLICAIKYENKQKLDYKHFISELPAHLGIELSFRMYYDLVCAIPFFQNRTKAFIAAIGPLLRPMKIMKDETIFMEGDPADEVFFIKTGKVAYVLPKFHNFKFLKVREGYFFGEVDLLFYGEIRKYCAMAVKDCEFYVLNKKDFKKIFLMDFRDIGTELYVNAHPRKFRTRRVYKEALEICKLFQASPKTQGRRMSKHRLSLFRNDVQNAEEEESSDDSPNKGTKIQILPDMVEEEEDLEHKNLSPRTPVTTLKKAITLRKGENPFGRKSSFGEAIAAHKEKFADSQKLNQLSEKMGTLEDHLSKVVKLTTALSKKLAHKEKLLRDSVISLKANSPIAKSGENIKTITIIKTQPKNLMTLSPDRNQRFDFDEDFIDKIAPSTIASGSDHTMVQSVVISEGNPSAQRLVNSKDADIS